MSIIQYKDELDLQRKICKILNKSGYNFEKGNNNYFCDIFDNLIKVYCEVKTDGKFAPQQLLYGLAKENIQDSQYLALANEYEIRIYTPPKFEDILKFAKEISNDLSKPASSIALRYSDESFNILGEHRLIYNYNGKFEIDHKNPFIFLNNENYEYFRFILTKYGINPSEFINKFAKTWVNKSNLIIKNDNQTIFDIESGNSLKSNRNIKNKFDQILIQSTRIKPEDIENIIHKIDELSPDNIRRNHGKYWSNIKVSEIASNLVRKYVNPSLIFEPFVGGGNLIRDFVDECKGIANDIDENSIDLLEQEFEGYDWKFYKKNILTTKLEELYNMIPEVDEKFVIYTNPPFGIASANSLVSTKKEIEKMVEKSTKSRKNKIDYGFDKKESKFIGNSYGRGDLCLPSIGKMIEIIKNKGKGYLTFFSPFGVMLGRNRYLKLLKSLLKDFDFIYGEVFSGDMFGVSKTKPISFTIWKYNPNINTDINKLTFKFEDKIYELKILQLINRSWKYNLSKIQKNEILVHGNDTFNCPIPKMFHLQFEKGGSEMIEENVKISLNLDNIPDELVYGLWSIGVGYRSITKYPIIFEDCYTHLPDFTNQKTIEILSYITISALITEIKTNNCKGKIGFVGMNRVFKFGGERLTKGAKYLIDTYKDLKIGGLYNIEYVFNALKDTNPDDIHKDLRIMIKKEIEKRLDEIGYWDYLPIPDVFN